MATATTQDLAQLEMERDRSGQRYLEFLRVPSLSAGLYVLRKGDTDTQSSHTEDEVYFVVRGRARFRVGREDHAVHQGSVIYVPARVEHRFHEIDEDLVILVFFAPPEGTSAGSPERRA
jgi:mannose-6-phosphate isomerase-like protein (cupin superfamily)